MWPGGWGYIHRHTHTHSLSLPAHVLPRHQEEGPCKGLYWRWPTPSRVQSRVTARSQQPTSGLPSPGNAQQSPRLAGELSIPRQVWLGPWHSDRSAKRRTGFNLLLPAVLGLQEPDACQPARPGKGRGPSAPGSQQITLLGMELPPAALASLVGDLQGGHRLGRRESPTRAPTQPPPRHRG